jgi:hypothetical protein
MKEGVRMPHSKSRSKRNPSCRPSIYKRYKYLGKKVPDVNKCGLDTLSEVEGICKAIIRDYKSGHIGKRTASGRFHLLYYVVIPRDSKLKGKKRRAKAIVKKYWDRLKAM